ncbi:Uncharacterised protein [Chlamydia trachomatis]|nr:Uncharacterised protein [Chlamydia trachomatis]
MIKLATQKATAKNRLPILYPRQAIGPPIYSWDSFWNWRYLHPRKAPAYWTIAAKRVTIHIQSNAPGPPLATAIAIPAIFPVPKFPANIPATAS